MKDKSILVALLLFLAALAFAEDAKSRLALCASGDKKAEAKVWMLASTYRSRMHGESKACE